MHGTYGFLLKLEPREGNGTDDELVDAAVRRFEDYNYEQCDENNWNMPIQLVTFGGKALHANTRSETYHYAQVIPNTRPDEFERSRRFALGAVIADSHVYLEITLLNTDGVSGDEEEEWKRLASMTIDAVVEELKTKLSLSLASAFRHQAVGHGHKVQKWKRHIWTKQLECLEDSPYPPFSRRWVPPYDYRNFDLRENTEEPVGKDCAILFVDIHT